MKRLVYKLLAHIYLVFLIIILSPIFSSSKSFAAILFQDNFDNTDMTAILNRWETPRNTCGTNWFLDNGRIGININSAVCQTEFTPKDSVWGGWDNYIYEVDMIIPPNSGTDKNTAFRYSGSPNFNWYGLHFLIGASGSNVVLERVCFSPCNNSTTYSIASGATYHLKMIANYDHISAYIDGNLVVDIPHTEREFNTGKIALRAGVGGDPHSEVYFDNVVV